MEDELKISEMQEANSVNAEDLVMIVQNGINKKTKAKNIGTGGGSSGTTINVVDNLESTSETDALSAKQGKVLKEKIENSIVSKEDTTQANIAKRVIKHENGEYEEYGTISNITVPLNNIKDVTVKFDVELININYAVTYAPSSIVPFWTWARIVTGNKQAKQFILRVGNDGTSEIPNLSVDYILKGRWK